MSLKDNLISYYSFENSASDIVGTNNMTLSSIDYTATGKINSGLSISSSSGYMAPTTAFNQTNISFSFWFYYTTNTTWSTIIARDGGTYHHCLIQSDGQIGFYNSSFYSSGYKLTSGNWYHIVVVKEGTNEKIYVNNELKLDSSSSFDNATYNASIFLNYNSSGGTQGALGSFDELGVWDRALTEYEISELYNKGIGMTYPFDNLVVPIKPDKTKCKAYWKLNDLSDSTGNYPLTNNGATSGVSGIIDNAYKFTGDSQNLNIGTSTVLSYDWSPKWAVNVWVKGDSQSHSNTVITKGYSAGGGTYWNVQLRVTSDEYIQMGINDHSTSQWLTSNKKINLNEWNMLTFVYNYNVTDGSKLYVNGELAGTFTFTIKPGAQDPLYFGQYGINNAYGYIGSVDEASIYNDVLSIDEINYLYNNGNPTMAQQYPFIPEGKVLDLDIATLEDYSGNGNVVTATGTTLTTDKNGVYNRARSFNGSSDKIVTPYTGDDTFSIMTSFKKNTDSSRQVLIGKHTNPSTDGTILLILNNGTGQYLSFAIRDGGSFAFVDIPSPLTDNKWYHVIVTYDGSDMKMYLDSVLVGTTSKSFSSNFNPFYIGARDYSGAEDYFNGDMGNTCFWNRVLTPEEVYQEYMGITHNYKELFYKPEKYLYNATFDDDTSDGWISIDSNTTSSVSSGEFTHIQTLGNSIAFRSGTVISGDWTAEFKVKLVSGGHDDGGVCWNVQDKDNGYMLSVRSASDSLTFYKRVSGTWTSINGITDPALSNDTYYIYKIVKNGSTYSFYINGVLKFSATDSTFTSGYLGSRPNNTSQVYDYVRVTESAGFTNTGLVAGYDFKGDAKDFSGNGNDGTVSGATLTTDQFGNSDSAYSFDGSERITITDSSALDLTTSMSLHCYCTMDDLSSNAFIDKWWDGSNRGWGFKYYPTTDLIRFRYATNSVPGTQVNNDQGNNVGALLTDGKYHLISFTWDGNIMRMFIDGEQIGSDYLESEPLNTNNANVYIGDIAHTSAHEYYNGDISTVLVYNIGQTKDEVKTIYDLTKKGYIYPYPLHKKGVGLSE